LKIINKDENECYVCHKEINPGGRAVWITQVPVAFIHKECVEAACEKNKNAFCRVANGEDWGA
jgi:hypothetical protein